MNPLLSEDFLIPFDAVSAADVEPGVDAALERARRELDALVEPRGTRSYDDTLGALDVILERVARAFGIASHLNAVMNGPAMRAAFNAVLPRYSEFFARIATDERLWRAVRDYAATDEAAALTGTKRRHLDKTVREFVRAGADLAPEAKARLEAIKVELSRLGTRFGENVLDATNAFELVLTDEADLAGLPETSREVARESARAKGLEGWRFTLHDASYGPFMKYAERRDLRRAMHDAFESRAADGEYDNRPAILAILRLRHELAELLGYDDFADFQLELRMVGSGAAALDFERELHVKTVPYWRDEVALLERFAERELGLADFAPWDLAFVAERLRKARFDLDDEDLRPYFPLASVLDGMFEIAGRLFGVRVTRRDNPHVWHPDVDFFEIHDEEGTHLGSFYADWFPRESKREGAWMNSFITGGPTGGGGFAPHLGLIVANFTPPTEGKPALLTHREVQTTFHEFGHLLHHCLSRVDVASRAGTNVAWDFVELPSQIMENWTWEREALDLFARHWRTGERLPEALFERLAASRTFLEAMAQMRQLSFGTLDLLLHTEFDPDGAEVVAYAQEVMEAFALRPEFARNSFLTRFRHIFAGGYAAGYYSYKWSEVLDADAFTRFRDEGIFNRDTGRAFVDAILSRGDSEEPEVLYREFMGRGPDVDALLDRNLGPREPVGTDD